MNEIHLTGLEGNNPLGFLAALGVQVAFESDLEQPRLWWSDDITPHAVVDGDFGIERIADRSLEVFESWAKSPALTPRRPDGSAMPKGDELKLKPAAMREYLREASASNSNHPLATALVADGSLDNQGIAKPSDLYFAAGKMKFLDIARKILAKVSREDVLTGFEGPWPYNSELQTLKWDIGDDPVYALRSDKPRPDKKRTNPGPEALAILGLSRHPVFAGRDRTLTQGCSGSWKSGSYSWPLWRKPASPNAVKSLLAHVSVTDRSRWFRSWGITRVFRSSIRRSDEGGYGTFSPPEVAWQAQTQHIEQARGANSVRLKKAMGDLGPKRA